MSVEPRTPTFAEEMLEMNRDDAAYFHRLAIAALREARRNLGRAASIDCDPFPDHDDDLAALTDMIERLE